MMSTTTPPRKFLRLLLSASIIACALAGCSKHADQMVQNPIESTQPVVAPPIASLPLATTAAPELTPAPVASELPWPRRPIRVAQLSPYDRYGYLDQAYAMDYGFADAPPDYMVDYNSTYPWIWRASDGAYLIVEILPYGEREYYYAPGDDLPFFVSDPDYSYAYDGDELVGIYDAYGAPLDNGYAYPRIYYATRYFDRARDLYRAAIYRQRRSVYADQWWARRDGIFRDRQRWEQRQIQDPGWRSWRARNGGGWQQHWRDERNQHLLYASAVERDFNHRHGDTTRGWWGGSQQPRLASRTQPSVGWPWRRGGDQGRFGQHAPHFYAEPQRFDRQQFAGRAPEPVQWAGHLRSGAPTHGGERPALRGSPTRWAQLGTVQNRRDQSFGRRRSAVEMTGGGNLARHGPELTGRFDNRRSVEARAREANRSRERQMLMAQHRVEVERSRPERGAWMQAMGERMRQQRAASGSQRGSAQIAHFQTQRAPVARPHVAAPRPHFAVPRPHTAPHPVQFARQERNGGDGGSHHGGHR